MIKLIVVLAVAAIVGIGSKYVLGMKDDNKIEEAMEQVIEDHTGVDLDLSPTSSEDG